MTRGIGKGKGSWESLVRRCIDDGQLSPDATGIMYMMSLMFLQKLWPATVQEDELVTWLKDRSKANDATLRRAIEELIEEGYLVAVTMTKEAQL